MVSPLHKMRTMPSPDAEILAWLRLLLTPGLGRTTARRLLASAGSADAVWQLPLSMGGMRHSGSDQGSDRAPAD
jgi:DNA processing protein